MRALIGTTDPRTGLPLTDREICDELVLFMLAGHDTTSTTITYALWALGHHRELQDRVLVEVAELGDRPLTPADVPRLGFTVQVLHEALRLCPPAPVISRMVMQDIDVDGCRVEAGSVAIVGVYAMHRDPELWDDPLEFDPDRFSTQRSEGSESLAVFAVRRRAAVVHRRSLRHARGHACARDHRPSRRHSFAGP